MMNIARDSLHESISWFHFLDFAIFQVHCNIGGFTELFHWWFVFIFEHFLIGIARFSLKIVEVFI